MTGLPSSRPVSSRADAAFTRLGCYTNLPQRALTGAFKGSDAMTVEMCADFCTNTLASSTVSSATAATRAIPSRLWPPMPSAALPALVPATLGSETCGAGMRLDLVVNNLYSSYNPEDSAPAGTPYMGCFVDAGARVLPERVEFLFRLASV